MTKDELWQAILGEMELTVTRASFTTWFQHAFIVEEENDQIIIGVPNNFTQVWFERKYHDSIIKILKKLTENRVKNIIYKIEIRKKQSDLTGLSRLSKNNLKNIDSEKDEVQEIKKKFETNDIFADNINGLNPKYVFDKFIVGKNNELAHAAAKAIAEKPGISYNPLFLYGGVGLGKTHLLQAIGHLMLENNENVKVLYITCEKFTNDFVNAIRTRTAKEFQDKYRAVDLLIMDDIQFIEGKQETQEQFFHTFNELFQKNKQLVISSDRPPKAIPTLQDRLRSRFECGMIADITEPDFETRLAIITLKLAEKQFSLENEMVNFIASSLQTNIRELEGALNKIVAHHTFHNQTPTLDSIKSIISSLVNLPRKGSISTKLIMQIVSEYFDIEIDKIVGSSRKKELVVPRQIIMYLLRDELKYSFPNIGRELGGRDHTTAMHAHTKIKNQMFDDDKLKQDVIILRQKIFNSVL